MLIQRKEQREPEVRRQAIPPGLEAGDLGKQGIVRAGTLGR